MKRWLVPLLALALSAWAQGALKVGVVVSATGPAASLGIPERNTFLLLQDLLARTGGVAGRKVEFVILDDASDTTQAVRNTRRLVEEGVVAVVGTTTTPASLGMIPVVAEAKVPMISLAASKDIIYPWTPSASGSSRPRRRRSSWPGPSWRTWWPAGSRPWATSASTTLRGGLGPLL